MSHLFVGRLLSIAICATTLACAPTAHANETALRSKPDALLQIDMNRAAVVERIANAWSNDVSEAQAKDFKQKLFALRSDLLLAASASGSFDGVLEVLQRAQEVKPLLVTTRAKALGDTAQDLVYTPITPCRIIDTRTTVAGPLLGAVKRDFDVIASDYSAQGGSATTCGIDPGAVAIAVNLVSTAAPGSGNLVAYSSSLSTAPGTANVNFPGQAIQNSEANFAVVSICTSSCPSGLELSVRATSQTHLVADVSGYFKAPSGTVGDITAVTAGIGLTGGATSGNATLDIADTYRIPQGCATDQYIKFNGTAWVCASGTAGTQGPAGPAGPIGPTGPMGATGPQGTQGTQGATGPQGAAGPQGATGAQGATGPAGASGGGKLVDANSVVLGNIVSANQQTVTFFTSTGHLTTINWGGTFPADQIFYSGTTCTGTAYLNSGSDTVQSIYRKTLVFSGSLNTLMVPANAAAANGTVASVLTTNVQSIDNPTCFSSGATTNHTWQLVSTTRAAVGLPATIVAPLSVQ